MSKNRIVTAILVLALAIGNLYSANPKREMRSIWLATVWNIDWPSTKGTTADSQTAQKNQLLEYLDKVEALNMTSACFQVRSMGDAMYPSQYAPWSSYVSGTRGVSPGWDPLAFFVEEAHKRGIEAYAWLNPYRWSSGSNWSTSMDVAWQNSNMIIEGNPEDNNKITKTFNPALKETRQLIVNVIEEILNNYSVDGIIFDDYFYPSGGVNEDSSAPDYKDYLSSRPSSTTTIGDWRRQNVNDMVADVYKAINDLRPDVRFGISPAGIAGASASKYGLSLPSSYGVPTSDWQYAKIYSDPLAWMNAKTVDFISPQIYWLTTTKASPYGPLSNWWSDAAHKLGVHFYSSHSVTYIGSADNQSNWVELGNQVSLNRQYVKDNSCGSIYYSARNLTDGAGSYLKSNLYSTPSLVPEITWKKEKVKTYDKVANLTYNNGILNWNAVSDGKSIIRYTVYAMPLTVTLENAKAADGDGFDVKYLQKVVYGTSYNVVSSKQAGYWYAVCVFDGYGKEHTAAVVNYPSGEAEKVTLVSPINGAVAEWDATFSWNKIENGTYTIEISDKADFSNIVYSQKNITKNSVIVSLDGLSKNKLHYWRVRSAQTGKLENVSDVATFITPSPIDGPVAVLSLPSDNAEIEESCYFSWTNVAGDVDNYTLQISSSKDFSSIKYNKDITYEATARTVSCDVNASILGKGTFYWRVLTKGSRINTGVSEVRSFTVTKVSVGSYETGYEIKTDKNAYSAIGSLNIKSVWMRSVLSDYANISFESKDSEPKGSLNRGMCAVGDYVYVSDRSENSATATAYLRVYSAATGELVKRLQLGADATGGYYPCNDVIKDSKGNICVTNLTSDISKTPLKLLLVDTNTGVVQNVATISTSNTYRIDHAAVLGDVTTGNFKVYAAAKGTNVILRWTFVNGTQTKEETCTVKDGYYSATFGIAPRITIVDENTLFVDDGSNPINLYDFSTGNLIGSFDDKKELAPTIEQYGGNGCAFFTLNSKNYIVYSYGDSNTSYSFNLVSINDYKSFSSMKLLWTLPKSGLGNENSTTCQAPVDYITIDNNTVRIFLYVPGCGLCAYDFTDRTMTSVVDTVLGTNFEIKVKENTVVMNEVAQNVMIFNMTGSVVKQASNVAELDVNLPAGVYVVAANVNGITYKKKIVIR